MSLYLSVHLAVRSSIKLSSSLPAFPSVCLPVYLLAPVSVCLHAFLSLWLSIYLAVRSSIKLSSSLPACLLACLFVCPSVCSSGSICPFYKPDVHPSIFLSPSIPACLSVYLFACRSVRLSRPSVCLSLCLSVCPSVWKARHNWGYSTIDNLYVFLRMGSLEKARQN